MLIMNHLLVQIALIHFTATLEDVSNRAAGRRKILIEAHFPLVDNPPCYEPCIASNNSVTIIVLPNLPHGFKGPQHGYGLTAVCVEGYLILDKSRIGRITNRPAAMEGTGEAGEDELTTVKVKFRGSKLATGSSKMPDAKLGVDFMQKLTPSNRAMIESAVSAGQKKKKGMAGDHAPEKRRRVSIHAPLHVNGAIATSGVAPSSCVPVDGTVPNVSTEIAPSEVSPNRTQGGLCPKLPEAPHTARSALYPLIGNRKQLQKVIDSLDPSAMDVTCDFDLWAWLEAQKVFAPFSYKTHDLSALALQDIGLSAVLERWAMPPLGGTSSRLDLDSSRGLGPGDERPGHSVPPPPTPLQPLSSGLAGDNVAQAVSSRAPTSLPLVPPTAKEAQWIGEQMSAAHSALGIGGFRSPLANHPGPALHLQQLSGLGAPEDDQASPPPSSSSRQGAASASPQNRGVDDPADPSDGTCPFPFPYPSVSHAHGENGHSNASPAEDLDAYLESMEAVLREQRLENNRRIAALRRGPLQSSAVRGELAAAQAQIERERSVLVRWRKSKAYIPLGGRNGSNGAGGGSTSDPSTSIAGTATGGGQRKGKGGHIHRKKLGGY